LLFYSRRGRFLRCVCVVALFGLRSSERFRRAVLPFVRLSRRIFSLLLSFLKKVGLFAVFCLRSQEGAVSGGSACGGVKVSNVRHLAASMYPIRVSRKTLFGVYCLGFMFCVS